MATTTPRTGPKIGLGAGVVALIALALGSLEGDERKPYKDIGGIWTVCKGHTGTDIDPNRAYSAEECAKFLTVDLERIGAKVDECITADDVTDGEWVGYGLLAYNIGPTAFCKSTLVKLRNAGNRPGACAQISRWTYVAGKDCRVKANRCGGIPKRRAYERKWCEGGVDPNSPVAP